jgi:hypothetical protein
MSFSVSDNMWMLNTDEIDCGQSLPASDHSDEPLLARHDSEGISGRTGGQEGLDSLDQDFWDFLCNADRPWTADPTSMSQPVTTSQTVPQQFQVWEQPLPSLPSVPDINTDHAAESLPCLLDQPQPESSLPTENPLQMQSPIPLSALIPSLLESAMPGGASEWFNDGTTERLLRLERSIQALTVHFTTETSILRNEHLRLSSRYVFIEDIEDHIQTNSLCSQNEINTYVAISNELSYCS